MKFSELQLQPAIQQNLDKIQFLECTQIQDQAIPWIRKGKDVAGLAQTGTGKTGAFLIPLIDRLLKGTQSEVTESETAPFQEWKRRQYILVLVPTRELADQVDENARRFLEGTPFRSVAIYGGTSYEKQIAALKDGVEIVIATPGRLIDLYKEHLADLGLVRAVVFDEADRMFDMGFKDDMKFILKRIPRERQFLVFSATLNFDVLNVAYEFGAEPVEVNISRDQAKAENVKDFIVHLGQDDKPRYLLSLLKKFSPRQAIIFSNFKHNVDRLTRFLNSNGVPAVGISSLLTQAQRNRVMEQFKAENDRNILVATDVAARGLDILGVDLVANFELPDDPENYVHRIGRTGRAGQTGQALSLVSDRDVDALQRIEDYLKHKIEALWVEETELVETFEPYPREEGRPGKFAPKFGGRREGRPQSGGGPRREGSSRREPRREGRPGGGPPPRHRDRFSGRHRQDQDASSGGGDRQGGRDQSGHDQRRRQHGGTPRHQGHQAGGASRSGGGHGRTTGSHQNGSHRRHGVAGSTGGAGNASGARHTGSGRSGSAYVGSRHSGGKSGHGAGSHRHPSSRRGSASVPPVARSASLGSKVSKFFKKLFGQD